MIGAEFLLTAFIVVVVPGTGVIYTTSTALSQGTRAGIIAAIGCTLGILPHLTAAILGISAILHMSALVFRIVRIAGVAYLLYLAYTMWRAQPLVSVYASGERRTGLRIAGRAVILNLLNPKLTVFFFAFLPQFLPADATASISPMLTLSGMFMIITLVVFAIYGVLAGAVRQFLSESSRKIVWIQRSLAGVLAFFAFRLAITSNE